MRYSRFFGNPNLIIELPGEVTTDPYGLETCTTVFKCSMDRWDLVPSLFSANPFLSYLRMEKRQVSISGEGSRGFLRIAGEYAGIPGGQSVPIFEVGVGVGEEPIQTHKNFVSGIGGKPSSPLNGAVFLDETGAPSSDDAKGIFSEFRGLIN